jgi:CDP-glucose 4,6-dehydratase
MVSVSDVLAKVVAVFGRDVGFHSTSGEKTPHEATLLRLDASKAKDEMGWQPQWQLDTAIEETISWYCDYLDGKDMIDVTARQIEEYERGMCS